MLRCSIWSSENNGGKKKVLASVLAGLAMVGLGATVQAADMNTDTSANTRKPNQYLGKYN